MLTLKQYQSIAKNGITFKLSADGKYANVYKNEKFVSSIFDTKNTIFFCGKDFLETTSKDVIDFLKLVNELK